MEWRKLKTFIILILLLVNGFLLVLVAARSQEAAQYERSALAQTVKVLERSGIYADHASLSAADSLVPLSAGRDLDRELQIAQALLGKERIQAENQGGGLYFYHNSNGDLSVRAGGELSAQLTGDPDQPVSGSLERHAADLLKKAGIDAEQIDVTEEDEWTRVRFRQLWNGAPVFSCQVEFAYRGGALTSIQGVLLTAGSGTAEDGQAMTLPTALLRFLDEVTATGDVCSSIQSMQAGYRGTVQSLSGGVRLTPVWLVSTDTASYYLDCVTGSLTRASDQ